MPLEIAKMVTISTSHIPESTAWPGSIDPDARAFLDNNAAEYREGWLLSLAMDRSSQPWLCTIVDTLKLQDEGVDYLRLDADGPVMEGLATYVW